MVTKLMTSCTSALLDGKCKVEVNYNGRAWSSLTSSKESVRAGLQPCKVNWDNVPVRDDLPFDQIFIHRITTPLQLRASYQNQGWNTDVILQSPTHTGPTTAHPIGFPFNFPPFSSLLSKWGGAVVLRLHIDIVRYKGKLASWPHAEPDPKYEPEKHIEMFLAGNEIRGPEVINIFGQFYHD